MSAPFPSPAFPVSLQDAEGHQDGPRTWQFPGLTKRELFAAMAMQGFAADPSMCGPVKMAEYAVNWADALLAELAKDGAA